MYDVIVVGGGIVGLATAFQVLKNRPGTKLLLLEKEDSLAAHQTGHNSGVIHSGLYYKPGSLKALNCIRGYNMLVDFCEQENLPYDLCGKVVVATEEHELPILKGLFERGKENGLDGLKMLNSEEIREYETHCSGLAGIRVPQTGIVDYKQVAERYGERIKEMGGEIRLGERVTNMKAGLENLVLNGQWRLYGTFHNQLCGIVF